MKLFVKSALLLAVFGLFLVACSKEEATETASDITAEELQVLKDQSEPVLVNVQKDLKGEEKLREVLETMEPLSFEPSAEMRNVCQFGSDVGCDEVREDINQFVAAPCLCPGCGGTWNGTFDVYQYDLTYYVDSDDDVNLDCYQFVVEGAICNAAFSSGYRTFRILGGAPETINGQSAGQECVIRRNTTIKLQIIVLKR